MSREFCSDVWQMNIGVSIRMAALMGLHREATYTRSDPTPDSVAKAESARRTLVWYSFLCSDVKFVLLYIVG